MQRRHYSHEFSRAELIMNIKKIDDSATSTSTWRITSGHFVDKSGLIDDFIQLAKGIAIISGGGHWDEMLALPEDLAGVEMIYVNTFSVLAESLGLESCYFV